MSRSLQGKTALVTGAARGQGASHCSHLCEAGARVLVTDILESEGQATAESLRRAGHEAEFVHLDVRNANEWSRTVATAEEEFGHLDILVNNAGMMTSGDVTEESEDNWDYVIDVNQKGTWLGMRAAIPAMRRTGNGSIVNIASTFAVRPPAHGVAYAAAKGAVRTMTRNAAMASVQDGIRVNCVVVPMVDTEFLASAKATGAVAKRVKDYPMGRIAVPADISPAVVFLASSDAAFMTGSELVVDGGLLAGTAARYDEEQTA